MLQSATLPPGCPLHLGEVQRICRQGNLCRARNAGRLLAWLCIVVGFTLLYGWIFWERYTSKMFVLGLVAWLFFAGTASYFALPKLRTCFLERHDLAVLFANGFAYWRAEVWRSYRWEEITEVSAWVRFPQWDLSSGEVLELLLKPIYLFLRGYTHHYVVTALGDMSLCLGETLSGVDDLMQAIQQRTYECRLKRTLQAFDAGSEVYFGLLTMQISQGVGYRGRWYSWEQVGYIEVAPGESTCLKIEPLHGHWGESMQVPWEEITNEDLLQDVVFAGRRPFQTYVFNLEPSSKSTQARSAIT